MFRLPTSKLQELRDRLQSRGARPSILLTTPADRGLAEALAVVEEYGPMCDAEEQELLERRADAFHMDEHHATALLDELHLQAG